MGRLIKNHWARLITITAASSRGRRERDGLANIVTDQIVAAFESFFWPKIFWDFLTKSLDAGIKPIPILQVLNLVLGFVMLAWEWPIGFLAGSSIHRSLEARLAAIPLFALCALLIYQGTNAGIYYLVAMVIYFWAYSEGEIICAKPWTLPQRNRGGGSKA